MSLKYEPSSEPLHIYGYRAHFEMGETATCAHFAPAGGTVHPKPQTLTGNYNETTILIFV